MLPGHNTQSDLGGIAPKDKIVPKTERTPLCDPPRRRAGRRIGKMAEKSQCGQAVQPYAGDLPGRQAGRLRDVGHRRLFAITSVAAVTPMQYAATRHRNAAGCR